jgi:hypothetical protein
MIYVWFYMCVLRNNRKQYLYETKPWTWILNHMNVVLQVCLKDKHQNPTLINWHDWRAIKKVNHNGFKSLVFRAWRALPTTILGCQACYKGQRMFGSLNWHAKNIIRTPFCFPCINETWNVKFRSLMLFLCSKNLTIVFNVRSQPPHPGDSGIMARVCHMNRCPVGVATQREDLRSSAQSGSFPGSIWVPEPWRFLLGSDGSDHEFVTHIIHNHWYVVF